MLIQTLGFEVFAAMQQGFRHMFFNGAIGYAKFRGGFGVGHAINSIQDKYLPGAHRQFIQYLGDRRQSFIDGYEFFGGGEFAGRQQGLVFALLVVFRYFPVFDVVVGKVFGNSEQKAARMVDSLFLRFAEKDNKAFLGQVCGYFRAVDNPSQVKAQFGLMI